MARNPDRLAYGRQRKAAIDAAEAKRIAALEKERMAMMNESFGGVSRHRRYEMSLDLLRAAVPHVNVLRPGADLVIADARTTPDLGVTGLVVSDRAGRRLSVDWINDKRISVAGDPPSAVDRVVGWPASANAFVGLLEAWVAEGGVTLSLP